MILWGLLVITSMICVQIWNIRLSVEYMSAFLVAMIISIAFILMEHRGNDYLIGMSVAAGTMVAFFDFLTTETVTILLSMLLVVMIRHRDGRLGNLKNNLIIGVKMFVASGMPAKAEVSDDDIASADNHDTLGYEVVVNTGDRLYANMGSFAIQEKMKFDLTLEQTRINLDKGNKTDAEEPSNDDSDVERPSDEKPADDNNTVVNPPMTGINCQLYGHFFLYKYN